MPGRGENRDAVARRAREVLAAYRLGGPPVSLEDLCAAAGIGIFLRPFDYVAGVFLRDAVFPVIIVNARERRARQRFTIAHELGHHFLKHRRRTYAEPSGDSRQERDAERFAACLLMPETWVREKWLSYAANAENRLSLLADIFDVSLAALKVRAKELGLERPASRPRK